MSVNAEAVKAVAARAVAYQDEMRTKGVHVSTSEAVAQVTKPVGGGSSTFVACTSFALAGAGGEVQLLPAGEFRAWDGRPKDVRAWRVDARTAEELVSDVAARGTPLVIDYEHQTLHAAENGQPAPAAGWFSRVVWRVGQGLFAVGVEWTAKARAMIAAGEYRYISPVFSYDNTGMVTRLLHAALTNFPAVDGMAAVAARFGLPPAEGPTGQRGAPPGAAKAPEHSPKAVAMKAVAYQHEMRAKSVLISTSDAVAHAERALT